MSARLSLPLPALAIEHAVTEHRGYLLRFARLRLRDRSLVEDVVQDTIVAALQGAARFAGRSSARTWLTGILLRRIADAQRRRQRAQPAASAAAAAPADDTRPSPADPAPDERLIEHRDPQRLLESRQSVTRLEDCLKQLPAGSARIVLLREVDGLSTDETARHLGVTPSQVSSLLHRARRRLRDCLSCD